MSETSLDNETSLQRGNFLEVIKTLSTASIRGIKQPHLLSLSKFLFHDYHLQSLADLQKYSISSSKVDLLTLYFGFAVLCFELKFDELEFRNEKKKMTFKDKSFLRLLTNIKSFITKPHAKHLKAINNLDIVDDIKIFSEDFCFKLSELSLEEYKVFFPEMLEDIVIEEDDSINVQSFERFCVLARKRGFFVQSFLIKFHKKMNVNLLYKILDYLISHKIYDAYLLHLFMKNSFDHSFDLHNYFLSLNEDIQFLDKRLMIGLSHYLHIYMYLRGDYNNIISWFNQFTVEAISHNEEGNVEWDLDSPEFNPLNYSCYQKNARIYLNCLLHLVGFREQNKNLYQQNKKGKIVNVIGGIHTLSWANLSTDDFHTEVSFNYSDFYSRTDNSLNFNFASIKKINESSFSTVLVLDIEQCSSFRDESSLENFFKELKKSVKFRDLNVISLPYPTAESYEDLPQKDQSDIIADVNSILLNLKKKFKYNFIDINSYLTDGSLIDSGELINKYLVKPDTIVKLVTKEIINR